MPANAPASSARQNGDQGRRSRVSPRPRDVAIMRQPAASEQCNSQSSKLLPHPPILRAATPACIANKREAGRGVNNRPGTCRMRRAALFNCRFRLRCTENNTIQYHQGHGKSADPRIQNSQDPRITWHFRALLKLLPSYLAIINCIMSFKKKKRAVARFSTKPGTQNNPTRAHTMEGYRPLSLGT